MDKFSIEGGAALYGEVEIQSAKNAVLPLLAASILTEEDVTLYKCPEITDVRYMIEILSELGCQTSLHDSTLYIKSAGASHHEIPARLTKEIRSSIFMLGSVIARFGRARIAYPGGCDIGLRPIDLHLSSLKQLGVKIIEEGGYIECQCERLQGAEICLDCPSVGATENIVLAAVLAKGKTVIYNAAKEPEIVDLQNFLNAMGAKVHGAGSAIITIDGVSKLNGVAYTPMPDRIEAGTFLIASAICGGELSLVNAKAEDISSLLHKLRQIGCKIYTKYDKIHILSNGVRQSPKLIETSPYPGYPTDLQAQMSALATVCNGSTVIVENLFETRFKHLPQLQRMGADITVRGKTAFIRGVKQLHGAEVVAGDLRGGAALTLAALAADGVTTITNLSHIDRGYMAFDTKLKKLGAKIERLPSEV